MLSLNSFVTPRLSATLGTLAGVLFLIKVPLLQNLIIMIPKGVFVGDLIKVGYDGYEFSPLRLCCKQVVTQRGSGKTAWSADKNWQ